MTQPEELTTAEILQLNGFMWTFADHLGSYRLLWDWGIFGPPQETYEKLVIDVADIYFGSGYGRAWFEENKSFLDSTTVEILDAHLPNLGRNEYLDQFQRIQDSASILAVN